MNKIERSPSPKTFLSISPNWILKSFAEVEVPLAFRCDTVCKQAIPTFKLLLRFLKEKIGDKLYQSNEELQTDLDQWSKYCQTHQFALEPDYSQLKVIENGIRTDIVFYNPESQQEQDFFLVTVTHPQK